MAAFQRYANTAFTPKNAESLGQDQGSLSFFSFRIVISSLFFPDHRP